MKKNEIVKRIAEIDSKLQSLDLALTKLMEEDRTEYAQNIIDKMFSEFKDGARWTYRMQGMAEKEYHVYAPNGRIRHLYASLTGDRRIVAKQIRRGSNAPIQGMASELSNKAARLIFEHYYKNLNIFKDKLNITKPSCDLQIYLQRAVHDALYFMVPYETLIPFMHIVQHVATYGVSEAYKEQFNIPFTVEPEVEMEVGACDSKSYKIDWSLTSFVNSIQSSIQDADELGLLEGTPQKVSNTIFAAWKNRHLRKWLQNNYPLLNVKDLNDQIDNALEQVK